MARMQQLLGIGEDAVQMTIRRHGHSLIRTAPHVENLCCERTTVVRWRIHKYLLCLEIGLSQNIFHVLRYFGWCAVISIECGFHRHPFGFPAGLGYVRSGRKDVLIHLAADSCFASTCQTFSIAKNRGDQFLHIEKFMSFFLTERASLCSKLLRVGGGYPDKPSSCLGPGCSKNVEFRFWHFGVFFHVLLGL